MCNHFLLGSVIRLSAEFRTVAGVLITPSTVSLRVKKPDLTIETVTPTIAGVGIVQHDYTPATTGAYYYVFTGTGVAAAVAQGQFAIDATVA